jgi:hypothetical protein
MGINSHRRNMNDAELFACAALLSSLEGTWKLYDGNSLPSQRIKYGKASCGLGFASLKSSKGFHVCTT